MGISERKEREKTELRELILMKAKEILSKEGRDQLSIRKIATAAEYSPATIYLYFKDKDEILFSLMEMGFTLMGKFLMEAISEPDPVKRIAAIGRGYVRFGIDNPDWYELMFNSEKPMNHLERCKEVWGQGLSLFELLVSTCQEVIDNKRTKADNPHIMALQLWSNVHGLVSLVQSQRLDIIEHAHPDHLVSATLDHIMNCVFIHE